MDKIGTQILNFLPNVPGGEKLAGFFPIPIYGTKKIYGTEKIYGTKKIESQKIHIKHTKQTLKTDSLDVFSTEVQKIINFG